MTFECLRASVLPSVSITKKYSYKPGHYLKLSSEAEELAVDGVISASTGYTVYVVCLDKALRRPYRSILTFGKVKLGLALEVYSRKVWYSVPKGLIWGTASGRSSSGFLIGSPNGSKYNETIECAYMPYAWLPEARLPVFLGKGWRDIEPQGNQELLCSTADSLLKYYGGPATDIPTKYFERLIANPRYNMPLFQDVLEDLLLATVLDGREYLVNLERATAQGPVVLPSETLLDFPEY
jgi:hypothetical protein